MKKILTYVGVALLLLSAVARADFAVNDLAGFNVGGETAPATISFVGCTTDTSDLTTYTWTNHATGTAGSRKTIVAVAGLDSATDFSIASMTVGGSAATEIVDSANTGSLVQSAIYIKDNPSGTTATVAVTFSEAITDAVICVWAAYDLGSESATATASQFQTSSAAITLSLNVNSGGIGVGISNAAGDASNTWTGMTERADEDIGFSSLSYSAADTGTAGSPLAVTSDWSGTNDSIGVSASFR